jgi:uncharacterized protein (DUF1778 family)
MASKYRVTINFDTKEEVKAIKRAAKLERRSMSQFVANTVVPIAKAVVAQAEPKGNSSETQGQVA